MKSTLLSLLVAGMIAGLGTSAVAQNVTAGDQPNADAANPQAAEPAADTSNAAQKDEEYQAALKKCETLDGDAKTTCTDEAKKKFGQM